MPPLRQRAAFHFLCAFPFLAAIAAAVRPLRVPGVYQSLGVLLCAAFCAAVWAVRMPAFRRAGDSDRALVFAGLLLITPFALVALLWVGLGTPWDATAVENRMRYAVLLIASIAVTGGFLLLKEPLAAAGERFHAPIAAIAGLLAGSGYLVWLAMQLGAYVIAVRDGRIPDSFVPLLDALDTLLFIACLLTYLATASLAAAFARARWLAPVPARIFMIVSLILAACLVARGFSYPNPTADAVPWYTLPGFIAGIPAVPWIMPHMLGVIALRRAAIREA